MKRFLLFVASLSLALPLAAQQGGDEPEYKPPARGAPAGRVGGGTRGLRVLPLAALAPDHTGLTISAQPALYYFLPASTGVRIALRPATDPNAHPLLEKDFAPAKTGIQRVDLKALGVTLAPGVEYRWTVSDARTSSTGMIRRLDPPADLARKLNGVPSGRGRYMVLAREGVWYDALDEVSRAADSGGGAAVAGRHRAALLEQIGLKDIAQHERQLYK